MAQERTAPSEVLERESWLGRDLAARMEEVARGQSCEVSGAEDMRKRPGERNDRRVEMEDGAGIV